MKRGGLFLIGIISAVITIISLNAAFGRNFNTDYRGRYGWHHRCYGRDNYDDRYHNERKNSEQQKEQQDSATGKY